MAARRGRAARRETVTPMYKTPQTTSYRRAKRRGAVDLRLPSLFAAAIVVIGAAVLLYLGGSGPAASLPGPTPPVMAAPQATPTPIVIGARAAGEATAPTAAATAPPVRLTPVPTVGLVIEGQYTLDAKGERVTRLQERLAQLGYLRAKPDGFYGPKTQNAVKAFQTQNGLRADGVAGTATLVALYADEARDVTGTRIVEDRVWVGQQGGSRSYHTSTGCKVLIVEAQLVSMSVARWHGFTEPCEGCK